MEGEGEKERTISKKKKSLLKTGYAHRVLRRLCVSYRDSRVRSDSEQTTLKTTCWTARARARQITVEPRCWREVLCYWLSLCVIWIGLVWLKNKNNPPFPYFFLSFFFFSSYFSFLFQMVHVCSNYWPQLYAASVAVSRTAVCDVCSSGASWRTEWVSVKVGVNLLIILQLLLCSCCCCHHYCCWLMMIWSIWWQWVWW